MKVAPDCYQCKYRREVPGSAHSSCHHPANEKAHGDSMLSIMAIFASVGRVTPFVAKTEGINVKGNPHGIKKGWFNYPFNFDPTWLQECDGFEQKQVVKK